MIPSKARLSFMCKNRFRRQSLQLERLECRQMFVADWNLSETLGNGQFDGDQVAAETTMLTAGVAQITAGQRATVAKVVSNRVPAEWEKHDSTWMQWPKGEEISNQANFAGIIDALQSFEQVNLVVESSRAQLDATNFLRQRGVQLGNIVFHVMPYDWSWMRDNGAIWVEQTDAHGKQSMIVQDWGFDGWGGDGGPSRKDDAVPPKVAAIEKVAVEKVSIVIEKGTLEFNGKDTVITSWTVLHDRNPTMSKRQLETALKDKFGVTKVVWLEGAQQGDITDGHVDGIARFVNERTVAVVRYLDQSDPDAALFEKAATTIRDAGFNVVRLDMPGYVRYKREWLPANYANYLVANGVVVASSYGNAQYDARAKAQLQQLFPDRKIIMIDTRELWLNGGAVHCVTNDQPLLRSQTFAAKSHATSPKSTPNGSSILSISSNSLLIKTSDTQTAMERQPSPENITPTRMESWYSATSSRPPQKSVELFWSTVGYSGAKSVRNSLSPDRWTTLCVDFVFEDELNW